MLFSILLFRRVLTHGRFLAAPAISHRPRTRSLLSSSRYLAAFSYTVAFSSSCNIAAFSHTVAFWQLLLSPGILVHGRFWQLLQSRSVLAHGRYLSAFAISQHSTHGRYLAAFAIPQQSRTRSLFGSFCNLAAFSHTVASCQLLLFHSILAHGR